MLVPADAFDTLRRSLSGQPMAGCIEGATEHSGNGWRLRRWLSAAVGGVSKPTEVGQSEFFAMRRSLSGGVAAASKGAAHCIEAYGIVVK